MFTKLAWRNIWRNPRRTAVILIAVVIGVWTMIFLSALTRGMMEQMVLNGISTLTGEIQIHADGYRSDPVVENSIHRPETVETALEKILPPGSRWADRVRVEAIASNARNSAGVTLVGVDPAREASLSFIGTAVFRGRYLSPDDDHGILVGEALAEKFGAHLGRKLILMSQDIHRDIASKAFRIVGIYRAEMEATEKTFVFVTRAAAQKMLKLGDGISEISILLPDRKDVDPVAARLRAALSPSGCDVRTWRQLLPIITAYLTMMDGWMLIWYVVVFIAMGFGIVNTLLMAVFERMREYGILKALGMKPRAIVRTVMTESFFLLSIGTAIGNLLAFLTVIAVARNGIDLTAAAAGAEFFGMARILYPILHIKDLLTADLIILSLGLLVSLYPAVKAARFTPVEAMMHT